MHLVGRIRDCVIHGTVSSWYVDRPERRADMQEECVCNSQLKELHFPSCVERLSVKFLTAEISSQVKSAVCVPARDDD
jgi:hypothetical protein